MELLSLLLLLFPSLPCAFSTSLLPISPSRRRSQTSLSMTGGDKRLEENSKLSGLLRKSGRLVLSISGATRRPEPGTMPRSGETGSLSPTARTDKAGAGPAGPRCPSSGETSARGEHPELQALEPLAGLSLARICPFAKRSLRKHLGQCRPSSQITFLPNYSPISPRPVLNFTRFGYGAELTHQEPPRTALPGHPCRWDRSCFQAAMHEALRGVFPPQFCRKQQNSCSWLQRGGCFSPS